MCEKQLQMFLVCSEKYKGELMQLEKAQHDLRSNIKNEFNGNKHALHNFECLIFVLK